MTTPRDRRAAGFTLLELLLVVTLLGILGGLALRQSNDAQKDAKEALVVSTLTSLRQGLELYRVQHQGEYPGSTMVDQLMGETTQAGTLPHPGHAGAVYGPYLRSRAFPANPVTGSRDVLVVDVLPPHPVGGEGWIYARETGDLRLNTRGRTAAGVPLFSL